MPSNRDGRRTHGGDKDIEEIGEPLPLAARAGPVALYADEAGDDVSDYDDEDDEDEDLDKVPDDIEFNQVVKSAISMNETGEYGTRRAAWSRSYRAWRNQHSEGSRYLKKDYGARSRLFVPKTRAAVRKSMSSAATALFSTNNVVNITAQNTNDPNLVATANINHELVNYRLDRSSDNEGIPWFMISMGAAQEASIVGLCCSKQYWSFEQDRRGKVTRDKPEIKLVPLDDVLIDTAAEWTNPVQTGKFFMVRYPMRVSDVKDRMRSGSNPLGGGAWNDLSEESLAHAVEDYASQGTRTARSGGIDRYSDRTKLGVKDFDIVWVYECFVKMGGVDYHFWSLAGRKMLSNPRPTAESYPHNNGERPYVIGFGALEAHNLHPMSSVEAMQPLQNEINDIRNLRIDTVRQSISPIAVVKRGNRVDMRNLHYRGPDATILVKEDGDVKFDRAPDASASSFTESDRLNNDIDELTGTFSTSSVQSNRALNETVGGMQLMAGAGNALTEFDLRVWVETWVEMVLRQLVRLEQYYETNEDLIALAGDRAKLKEKGIDPLEIDIAGPILVKVDLGIGASDPMQKLSKMVAAVKIGMELAPTFGGQVTVKAEGILSEVFGLSGYRDISSFFEFKDPKQAEAEQQEKAAQAAGGDKGGGKPPPDPAAEAAKIDIDRMDAETRAMAARAKAENDRALTKIKYAEMLIKKVESEGALTMDGVRQNQSQQQMELDRIDQEERRALDATRVASEAQAQPPSRPPAATPEPRPMMPPPSPQGVPPELQALM